MLCTRVLRRQDDIDHYQEVESTEEDHPEDIQDHGELVHRREGEGFRDLQEDTTGNPCPEAEVDPSMNVMDHGGDCRRLQDAGDPIHGEDQDRLEGRETEGTRKDPKNVAEAAASREVDPDDPP